MEFFTISLKLTPYKSHSIEVESILRRNSAALIQIRSNFDPTLFNSKHLKDLLAFIIFHSILAHLLMKIEEKSF